MDSSCVRGLWNGLPAMLGRRLPVCSTWISIALYLSDKRPIRCGRYECSIGWKLYMNQVLVFNKTHHFRIFSFFFTSARLTIGRSLFHIPIGSQPPYSSWGQGNVYHFVGKVSCGHSMDVLATVMWTFHLWCRMPMEMSAAPMSEQGGSLTFTWYLKGVWMGEKKSPQSNQ